MTMRALRPVDNTPLCGPLALLLTLSLPWLIGAAFAEDWPQWLGPRRDGQWHEDGIVEKLPSTGLTYRWRVPIGGGFAGPAVAGVGITSSRLAHGRGRGEPSTVRVPGVPADA